MPHTCKHNHSHNTSTEFLSVNAYDPTRTLTLRNSFAREMAKRFAQLKRIIRTAIVDDDILALDNSPLRIISFAERFDFPRSGDKVAAFTEWLDKQQQAGILEVKQGTQLGTAIEEAWTNKYIESAYQKGVARARQELKKAGYDVPSIDQSGGIGVAFNQPFHIDRVGLLYTRTYNGLKGITTQMDTQISQVLSQAMAEGRHPREIARLLLKTVSDPAGELAITDTLGRFIPAERRAKMLARTEVIRAHSQAMLQEFDNWKVAGVSVKAEFVTAGDDRVCFPANNTVNTKYGNTPIQFIKKGDYVYTRYGLRKVLETFKRKFTGTLIGILSHEGLFTCTDNHPIYINNLLKFKEAKNINIGDCLQNIKNQSVNIHHISNKQVKDIDVFNLRVEEYHEYYVKNILVHNCPECEALEAEVYTIEQAQNIIPVHPDCLTAETSVLAPDQISGFVTTYSGVIIEITLSIGTRLSITPNHMLLTPNGFILAKSLHEGDNVFHCPDFKRVVPCDPNDDRNPFRIDNIIKSFSESSGSAPMSMPASAIDLHGDGEFCEGNIDIINSDRFLRYRHDTFGIKQRDKLCLDGSGELSILLRQGTLNLFLKRIASSADCSMGRFRKSLATLNSLALHPDDVGLAGIPERNILELESVIDSWSGNFESFRKSQDTFSGLIEPCKIVNININHVKNLPIYDVQTDSTVYIANGVLSSNCRCTWIPVSVKD